MKRINVTATFGAALMLAAGAAAGQEVVLRIHHFLPPQATIQVQFFTPWCEKLGKESAISIHRARAPNACPLRKRNWSCRFRRY